MRTIVTTALLVSFSLLYTGCSDDSGNKTLLAAAASTSAATTSGATPAAVTRVGPLHKKALAFESTMHTLNLPLGQVQGVRVTSGRVHKLGNAPSRVLWTGFYAASQAMRYRTTQDPDALASMESALWTLHDLHEVTGTPGVIARGFDEPSIETNGFPAGGRFTGYNYNKGTPSRDQYTGWFYGVAQGFPHVQDPALRQALRADVSAICDRLMAGNLEMSAPWGPNGAVKEFFNLDPAYFYQSSITPQNWATVDDFPFNLITKSVPYSPQLANAISNARIPPIRAGEALRAVFFFTVAAEVTGDPRYASYKDQLLYQRGFADVMDDYLTILDDILQGNNLQVAENTVKQLFVALADILSAYLTATGQSALVSQVLVPALAPTLAAWLAGAATDLVAWIHDPANQGKLRRIMQQAQLLVGLLNLIGQQGLATQLNDFLVNFGGNLSHQGLIDFSNTVRSHLGTNLTLMPLAMLTQLEKNPQMAARYERMLERYYGYIKDDHNAMADLLRAGFTPSFSPNAMPHALEALRRYPVDMSMREVDHSGDPGLVVSPWPDRFGKVGNYALTPTYFPIDQRARDVFPWRGHPRRIKGGSNNPDVKVPPLGYLLPYWLARDLGAIGSSD